MCVAGVSGLCSSQKSPAAFTAPLIHVAMGTMHDAIAPFQTQQALPHAIWARHCCGGRQAGQKGMPAGTNVSNYKLGKEVGRGGFAIVYIAMDQTRGSSCAVKHMTVSSMDDEERKSIQVRRLVVKRQGVASHSPFAARRPRLT